MAVVQLRNPTEGRTYFDRRKTDGKTSTEAMRALKRRLSDLVYRQLLTDALKPTATGREGQPGNDSDSSAADSDPDIDSSDRPLPGPASTQPKSPLLAASCHRGAPCARGAGLLVEAAEHAVATCVLWRSLARARKNWPR
jgi:transposase